MNIEKKWYTENRTNFSLLHNYIVLYCINFSNNFRINWHSHQFRISAIFYFELSFRTWIPHVSVRCVYWFKSKFNIGVRTDSLAIRRYIGGKEILVLRRYAAGSRARDSWGQWTVYNTRTIGDAKSVVRRHSDEWARFEEPGVGNIRDIKVELPSCPHALARLAFISFEIVRCIGILLAG